MKLKIFKLFQSRVDSGVWAFWKIPLVALLNCTPVSCFYYFDQPININKTRLNKQLNQQFSKTVRVPNKLNTKGIVLLHGANILLKNKENKPVFSCYTGTLLDVSFQTAAAGVWLGTELGHF